jgi:hypothetical protein
LSFLYGFLKPYRRGIVFYQFSYFLLYRNCKRLREFEEIEISSKAVEMTVNNKVRKTFAWISSKNWASSLKHVSELTEESVGVEL